MLHYTFFLSAVQYDGYLLEAKWGTVKETGLIVLGILRKSHCQSKPDWHKILLSVVAIG